MSWTDPPPHRRSLEQRLRNTAGDGRAFTRVRTTMALVVVSQMLPDGAVKGGTAMAFRLGMRARFTRDLDAGGIMSLETFTADLEDALASGWAGFTGRLIALAPPAPRGVPDAYVMRPFDVKLSYQGQSWCTIRFELGQIEIPDAEATTAVIAPELVALFTDVGLPAPNAVPVLAAEHQIAQKLHAVSSPGSDRARDLVDLQLLVRSDGLDPARAAEICRRTFAFRRSQPWPPAIEARPSWRELYAAAAEGLPALPTVDEAVGGVNDLITTIDTASAERPRKSS